MHMPTAWDSGVAIMVGVALRWVPCVTTDEQSYGWTALPLMCDLIAAAQDSQRDNSPSLAKRAFVFSLFPNSAFSYFDRVL
jgi:hypothetical protein